MNHDMIASAMDYIKDVFMNDCGGHDVDHTLRVYHNAMKIADTEPTCDREIVALVALLHDVDDHKLFETKDNEHARCFLKNHQMDSNQIESLCKIINGISFSKNRGVHPDTLEGQIVQDADRLDAMGAIGIARTFAFGGERKRPLSSTIQHFDEKLLLLKDEMNTKEGKRIAVHRHNLMLEFLRELNKDLSSL